MEMLEEGNSRNKLARFLCCVNALFFFRKKKTAQHFVNWRVCRRNDGTSGRRHDISAPDIGINFRKIFIYSGENGKICNVGEVFGV
jgi:hypothetical protein